ncbi:hypothetical protein AB1E19_012803 [Capra hircus]
MGPVPQGSRRSQIELCGGHRLQWCQCQSGGGLPDAAEKWEEEKERAGRCCHRAPLDVTAARAPPPGLGEGRGRPRRERVPRPRRPPGCGGEGPWRRAEGEGPPEPSEPASRARVSGRRLAAPPGLGRVRWGGGRARLWTPRPVPLRTGARGPVALRPLLAPHAAPPHDPARRRREKVRKSRLREVRREGTLPGPPLPRLRPAPCPGGRCEAHAGTDPPGVTLRGGDTAQMLQAVENVQMKSVPRRCTSPCLSPARA